MKKRTLSALACVAVLSACATPGIGWDPAPASSPPVSLTKIFFYPQREQSEDQQDRDRYECHYWGVRQTGFDPSLHLAPGVERGAVIPARAPGQTIGTAAVVGAMIGAVAAGRGDTAEGVVAGAIAGTMVGAAAASSQEAEARRIEQQRNARSSGRYERYEKEAGGFRRAMSACLEGRGYSVK